jgi:hypothetical protein
MALPNAGTARTWGGRAIVDRTGAFIGPCTQIYTDDATGRPEWATARIGPVNALVPLEGAVEVDGQVQVSVTRDDVVRAPAVTDRQHVSPAEEEELYRHYGLPTAAERAAARSAARRGPRAGARWAGTRWVGGDADRRFAYLLAALVVAGLAVLTGLSARSNRRRRQEPTET